jgi:3-deoxy-manno-octulosonate cytidylyltransferase (CMP-KDO synthetase)
MTKSKILILIPARYASTRFPGKPLALLKGKTLISYVIKNMQQSPYDFAIVTDDQRIENECLKHNAPVWRVDDDVISGSERIALAYERFYQEKNYQWIINVQGDEPLLKYNSLKKLAEFASSSERFDICTLVQPHENAVDPISLAPQVVKVARSSLTGECFYFSRTAIPSNTKGLMKTWYSHVGVYAFRPNALEQMVKAPPSELEKIESLEQLRALEIGLKIGACEIQEKLAGVDLPEDITKVESLMVE